MSSESEEHGCFPVKFHPTQCRLKILNLDTEITTKGITQKKKTKIGNIILQLYKLLSNLYLVDFQGATYPHSQDIAEVWTEPFGP